LKGWDAVVVIGNLRGLLWGGMVKPVPASFC
jgi:hypothetical protein